MAPTFPSIYLLKWNFGKDPKKKHELFELEKKIGVVFDIKEADLVLGNLQKKSRAEHELRKLSLFTVDVDEVTAEDEESRSQPSTLRKKRKYNEGTVDGKEVIPVLGDAEAAGMSQSPRNKSSPAQNTVSEMKRDRPLKEPGTIKVLKHTWYTDSVDAGELLPVEKYLVYEGRIIDGPKTKEEKATIKTASNSALPVPPLSGNKSFRRHGYQKSRGHNSQFSPAPLLQETTEDHDANFPPIPEYLHTKYCCERPSPLHCPNEAFQTQLRILRKSRLLEDKPMNARAYNSAIATIASYPYTITSAFELKRLPNCAQKIAERWEEWRKFGRIADVEALKDNEKFIALSTFYDIHDVGYSNALKFWNRGWRDLDDIIEHGWNELTRNQQIGLKFREEFLERIPRTEVEDIANTVLQYANNNHPGFQMVICGGYRRGKTDSGDVDVILSHPDEEATEFILGQLLHELEEDGYVTHRLTYSEENSRRGQNTLKLRSSRKDGARNGFDTLDHAFVVWQDPNWKSMEEDIARNPNAVNPNLHRRVDIIISPWKTAGCAVLGWTGGTMFERDLRSYSREKKGWKFDSSGIRDVATGLWIDLEQGAETLLEKEKKVFEGLGLEWREPEERCTD